MHKQANFPSSFNKAIYSDNTQTKILQFKQLNGLFKNWL